MNFLKEEQNLSDDKLTVLSKLCYQQKTMEGEVNEDALICFKKQITGGEELEHILSIETLKSLLKWQEEKLTKIKQELIPSILNEVGLTELKLKTGEKVTIVNQVKPSLAKERIGTAIINMIKNEIENGLDAGEAEEYIHSLFKDYLKVDTNDNLISYFLNNDIVFDRDQSIHFKTLEKYCKEKIESGQTIPEEIKVYTYQEAKIK